MPYITRFANSKAERILEARLVHGAHLKSSFGPINYQGMFLGLLFIKHGLTKSIASSATCLYSKPTRTLHNAFLLLIIATFSITASSLGINCCGSSGCRILQSSTLTNYNSASTTTGSKLHARLVYCNDNGQNEAFLCAFLQNTRGALGSDILPLTHMPRRE
jgi:hypothetical protein